MELAEELALAPSPFPSPPRRGRGWPLGRVKGERQAHLVSARLGICVWNLVSWRLPFFKAGLGGEFVSLRVAGGLEFQFEPGRLGIRGQVMDGCNAGFSRGQVGGRGGAEAG